MIKSILAVTAILLASAGSAQAQVYRCGDSNVYTDKPCPNATPVDPRANVIDAGPRGFPAVESGGPAKIIYGRREDMSVGSTAPGQIWSDRDSREVNRGSTYVPAPGPR